MTHADFVQVMAYRALQDKENPVYKAIDAEEVRRFLIENPNAL